MEKPIDENRSGGKLIVLDVGLKHCGPCVKVYPTVLKLSRSMSETIVFARMNGDENDSYSALLYGVSQGHDQCYRSTHFLVHYKR
uniref:Thioredoxin domain-containing protein n=1 Tax=Brassica campestris TaxID=3711 RepID=A0A3P6A9D1_BRACM|nr:unnamed protein product [Brassica rapa]